VVDLSADGRIAASGTQTGTVIYWNVETGKELSRIEHGIDEQKRRLFMDINRSAEAVNSLTLSYDGRRALISFLDDTPIVWDFHQERMIESLRGHSQVVFAVSLHNDDRLAISGDRYGTAYLWDVSQGTPINCLLLDGSTSSTAFASNRVLICDVRGQVTFLEIIGTKSNSSNMALKIKMK
jgi:WD40 repeat protein